MAVLRQHRTHKLVQPRENWRNSAGIPEEERPKPHNPARRRSPESWTGVRPATRIGKNRKTWIVVRGRERIFPDGASPGEHVFNAHRVTAGDIYLVRDSLDVLQAKEQGIENVVAFLTETISAQQLEQLAALMDEKKCDSVALY